MGRAEEEGRGGSSGEAFGELTPNVIVSQSQRKKKRGGRRGRGIRFCSSASEPFSSMAAVNTGCLLREGNCPPYSGVSAGAVLSPRHGDCRKVCVRRYAVRRGSALSCAASSSGSQRKNPDFSRQSKGFSRGRSRQNQDRESPDGGTDDVGTGDGLSSKNGPLLSLSSGGPRQQATAAPGQREKEIVELFRKVQAQLRERAAAKEEKKAEAAPPAQGGGNERGTVDSLLKLLRKHSVDQGKKGKPGGGGGSYEGLDSAEKSGEEAAAQSPSFFESSSMGPEEDNEELPIAPPLARRPPSNFQRRSPVPRVKYQPVYSAEEVATKTKKVAPPPPPPVLAERDDEEEEEEEEEEDEPISLDDREAFDDEPSSGDTEAEEAVLAGLQSAKSSDLSSLKLSELRAIAKSRGLKGYSKLKKTELVVLLAGQVDA
ncbi:SAP-like protein BP-73 [Wolffia australiana]